MGFCGEEITDDADFLIIQFDGPLRSDVGLVGKTEFKLNESHDAIVDNGIKFAENPLVDQSLALFKSTDALGLDVYLICEVMKPAAENFPASVS